MKICFIGNARSSIIRSWAKHFTNSDHEVHLITSEPGPIDNLSIEGVSLHRIGSEKNFGFFNFLNKIMQTRRLLKKINPDVVHAHYVFGYGLLIALSGFHPFVATAMGTDIGDSCEISKIERWGVKYTMKKADIVAVKDEYAKKRSLELGCREDKIVIEHSFCDTSRFSPDLRSEELRKQLGISDKHSVIFTRPLNKMYRAHVLAKAIPTVSKMQPNVKFIIIERGQDWPKWKQYFIDNDVAENVIFLPEIPHEKMGVYLASVDAYVDTFYPEYNVGGHGHGTNTIEAMSCECPQILPDRVEYTGEWCHAILYPKGDPEGLAKAIIELFSDEKRRRLLGKESRKSAIEFGNEDSIMSEMFELYKRLICK